MRVKTQKIYNSELLNHETKKYIFVKFLILLMVLISYTGYLSYEYGFKTGGLLAIVSWSFFVLCTPVADAGMLLDFPVRLIFRLRMWITELIVWTVAININIYALIKRPEIYEKSFLVHIFHGILTQAVPYWSIIGLSFIGTFLSVHFADELMDYIRHSDIRKNLKHRLIFEAIVMATLFLLIFFIYKILLKKFDLDFSQF